MAGGRMKACWRWKRCSIWSDSAREVAATMTTRPAPTGAILRVPGMNDPSLTPDHDFDDPRATRDLDLDRKRDAHSMLDPAARRGPAV